ncbi:unnamed protein product [Caenorhabditis angaria]|uniref:Uncharacterized protein n=1 Tax=Caenorhabditis angaria TaxID=860376 RepID=A0A9P1IHF2_9PELO|nr:unnamed protein product [Caenorhabditis angaria]
MKRISNSLNLATLKITKRDETIELMKLELEMERKTLAEKDTEFEELKRSHIEMLKTFEHTKMILKEAQSNVLNLVQENEIKCQMLTDMKTKKERKSMELSAVQREIRQKQDKYDLLIGTVNESFAEFSKNSNQEAYSKLKNIFGEFCASSGLNIEFSI